MIPYVNLLAQYNDSFNSLGWITKPERLAKVEGITQNYCGGVVHMKTDPASEKANHFVAVLIDRKEQVCEWWDSLGMQPEVEFQEQFERLGLKIKVGNRKHQQEGGLCSTYACFFLEQRVARLQNGEGHGMLFEDFEARIIPRAEMEIQRERYFAPWQPPNTELGKGCSHEQGRVPPSVQPVQPVEKQAGDAVSAEARGQRGPAQSVQQQTGDKEGSRELAEEQGRVPTSDKPVEEQPEDAVSGEAKGQRGPAQSVEQQIGDKEGSRESAEEQGRVPPSAQPFEEQGGDAISAQATGQRGNAQPVQQQTGDEVGSRGWAEEEHGRAPPPVEDQAGDAVAAQPTADPGMHYTYHLSLQRMTRFAR
jgi:hypothetical protein